MDLILNSIVMKVKRNLSASDHAFSKEEKNYRPQPLEKEDDRRMPGCFDTRREVRRDDELGGQEGKESEGEKDSQNTHDLIRRYAAVAAIVSPQRFR